MPITQPRIDRLRSFGLTESAARVYLALLDLALAEARDVSNLSGVPTSKIYHILEQLNEKGLVLIYPETPRKYAPIAFNEYLRRLHREHEQAMLAIEAQEDEVVRLFSVTGAVDAPDRGAFTVLRGRRNVTERVIELIDRAERDLLVLATSGMVLRGDQFRSPLLTASARGVQVRHLVPVERKTLQPLQALDGVAEVRARDLVEEAGSDHVGILIADGAEALLIDHAADDARHYVGKDTAVFTDQAAMVGAMKALLEAQWSHAVPLSTRREEIEHGRRPEFVRIYPTWGAVFGAAIETLRRHAGPLDFVSTAPAEVPGDVDRSFFEALRAGPVRTRAILNVPDAKVAEGYRLLLADFPHVEARHLDTGTMLRFSILAEEEATFSIVGPPLLEAWVEGSGPPDDTPDLTVHTNQRSTLHSLRTHFDILWQRAIPLRDWKPAERASVPGTKSS